MNLIACTAIGGLETFGEVLQRRREERGWTITELSRRAHVARQSIYQWEGDVRVPQPLYRQALRVALNLSEDDDHGWWRLEW